MEATKGKLRQQLAAADHGLEPALFCTESSDRALAVAEKPVRCLAPSRRRPRQAGPGPRPEPSPSSPDREVSFLSPRSPRDVLLPAYRCCPINSALTDAHLDGLTSPEHHEIDATCESNIGTTAQAQLNAFESFPGAALRLVFRHIDTAPASPELTSAAHSPVDVLRAVHTVPGRCVTWPDRSTLGAAATASSPRRKTRRPPPRHGRRDIGR